MVLCRDNARIMNQNSGSETSAGRMPNTFWLRVLLTVLVMLPLALFFLFFARSVSVGVFWIWLLLAVALGITWAFLGRITDDGCRAGGGARRNCPGNRCHRSCRRSWMCARG